MMKQNTQLASATKVKVTLDKETKTFKKPDTYVALLQ
jgi:hypothetical protein